MHAAVAQRHAARDVQAAHFKVAVADVIGAAAATAEAGRAVNLIELQLGARHITRLAGMQRARFAVQAEAAPVPHAIGRVAGLLDLIGERARTEGVQHTGGNVIHVAGTHRFPVYGGFNGGRIARGEQLGRVGIRVHAVGELCARIAAEDHPRLGLAELAFAGGVGVVRVHLKRERIARVQEFQHQRKYRILGSGERGAPLLKYAPEALTGVRAVAHHTLHALQRGNLEAFARLLRRGLHQHVAQRIAAPGRLCAVAEIGRHQKRIELHCLFLLP